MLTLEDITALIQAKPNTQSTMIVCTYSGYRH